MYASLIERIRERKQVDTVRVDPSLLSVAKHTDHLFQSIDKDDLLDLEEERDILRY